jgi:archaellum component FlaF (FlaF/FlaG flagellin family)
MALKDLEEILRQVHEPDEYQLVHHDMNHSLYWIWKLENAKLKDLDINLREFRAEHARFDIFINGQYVLENDYDFEIPGKDIHIKFKKANFDYNLVTTDDIKIEGDIQVV